MANAFQRFAEWYLDLPSAGSGQGTTWRLEWGPSVGADYAATVLLAVAAIALVIMAAAYFRETSALAWRSRALLLSLRLGVVLVLLMMLGRLSIRVDRTELPTVAVLIDTSASMGLTDRYTDPAAQRVVRDLAVGREGRTASRLDLVSQLLTRNDRQWLRSIEQSHRVRLFAFDQHLRSLESDVESPEPADDSTSLPDLTATGSSTALREAIQELLDEFRGTSLAAVVVLTDGIASAGGRNGCREQRRWSKRRGFRCIPSGLGARFRIRIWNCLTCWPRTWSTWASRSP